MAYTLQEYYDGPASTQIALTTNLWGCQTFTPAGTFTITAVSVLCYRALTPGTINVGIFATSSGKPTGSALCSTTLDPSAITTNSAGEWKFVTFASPVELTASTVYALVLSRTDTDGTFYWKMDATSPTYAGGSWVRSNDAGASWTIYTATDTLFRTYSGTPDAVYVDAECTVTCTSSLSISAEVVEFVDAAVTIMCTSTITISIIASLRTEQMKSRLIVIGNNQLYYEDI